MPAVAPLPNDEARRLETLRRYAILDTPAEPCFDRIARLAARQFRTPIALISLVDERRQWFKAKCGLAAEETDRDIAFCAHTILHDDVLVVPDTRLSSVFADNPLVTGEPGIRFYAGAPLVAPDGTRIGTLCVIDTKPRDGLNAEDQACLRDFAAITIDELEMRAAAGGFADEIEARLEAEGKLKATAQKLDSFVQHAPFGVAMLDISGRFLSASERWRSDHQLTDTSLLGQHYDQVAPGAAMGSGDSFDRCLSGEVVTCAEQSIKHGGDIRWRRWELHPWWDDSGELGGVLAFSEDITEQKQVELQLKQNKDFLAAVLDSIQEGIVACDAEGRLSLFNQAARRFHGIAERPITPDRWAEYYDLYRADGKVPLEQEEIPLFRAIEGNVVRGAEMVIAPRDQPPRQIIANACPFYDSEGNKLGAVASMVDVTEQKTLENQLVQSQKMEAVGQLTGGLAHDFNNLLAVVLGNLELLGRSIEANEKAQRRVSAAIDAAQSGAELTKRLLAFSRRQVLQAEVVLANDLIRDMEELLKRTLGEVVELRLSLSEECLRTNIDPSQLKTAILNLAVNARDAMPDGGKLTIESALTVVGEADAVSSPEAVAGEHIVISVSDNGCGMSPEVARQVFEPFFTTKEVGKGTGLGLSMVYGFAKQSGGYLDVISEVGAGTTVRLYLPRDKGDCRAKAVFELPPSRGSFKAAKVLVVEDRADVRAVASAQLLELGCAIVEAKSGAEALDLLQCHADIDLLFTDIVMAGGMSGIELAKQALLKAPRLKLLYTSGFAEASMIQDALTDSGQILLTKPYGRDDLARALSMALDQGDGPAQDMESIPTQVGRVGQ